MCVGIVRIPVDRSRKYGFVLAECTHVLVQIVAHGGDEQLTQFTVYLHPESPLCIVIPDSPLSATAVDPSTALVPQPIVHWPALIVEHCCCHIQHLFYS